MTIYCCKNCGLPMMAPPSYEKGRCPECGYKLYPIGYTIENIPDSMTPAYYYPAPSWEEDLK